jgi:hypothetical protein
MGRNLPPGCSVSDLPGSEPRPEPYEDRKQCRHCGNTIEDHPEDHDTGCEAVADEPPDPPEEVLPNETDMIIPERDEGDGDGDRGT